MTSSNASPRTSACCRATSAASSSAATSTARGDTSTRNRSTGITALSSCKRWRVSSRNIRAADISPIQTWSASTSSIYVNRSSSISRRRRIRGRAVTVAGANDHTRFFDTDFDSPVCAVLLHVARVVTERVLVAQFFGYVRKSLRDVIERVGFVKPPAAAVGQFLQVTRRLAVFAAARPGTGRRSTRPLWEYERREMTERPALAVRGMRSRPRPGTGAGGGTALLVVLGVVFDRIDQRARFFHLIECVLVVGAAACGVDAVGEKHDGFAALDLFQAVDYLIDRFIKFRAAAGAGLVDRLAQHVVIVGEIAMEANLAVERHDHHLVVASQLLDEGEGGVLDVVQLEHSAVGRVDHERHVERRLD